VAGVDESRPANRFSTDPTSADRRSPKPHVRAAGASGRAGGCAARAQFAELLADANVERASRRSPKAVDRRAMTRGDLLVGLFGRGVSPFRARRAQSG
jgi:hypothetical protein